MKCPKCGKKNDPDDDFCAKCGEKLKKQNYTIKSEKTHGSSFKWVLIIGFGICLGFVLFFIGCSMLVGVGVEKTVKEMEKSTTPEVVTTDETGIEKPAVTEKLVLVTGQSAQTLNLKVTVLSAMTESSYFYTNIFGEEDAIIADEGNTFVLAEVEFENVGNSRTYISGGSFNIQDSEGYRYDTAYYQGEGGLDMFKELYPNQKTKGKIIFQVPEEATGLQIVYDFGSLFTNIKLVYWTI